MKMRISFCRSLWIANKPGQSYQLKFKCSNRVNLYFWLEYVAALGIIFRNNARRCYRRLTGIKGIFYGSTEKKRSIYASANERALLKGRELGADVLIMDLEDGVAPDAKTRLGRGLFQS